jgi:hypothetical protein
MYPLNKYIMSFPLNSSTITRNEVRPSGKIKFTADLYNVREFNVDAPIKEVALGYKRFLVDKKIRNTCKGVLVVINANKYWLPNSWVTNGIEEREGKRVRVIDVPDWLVKNRGLE